MGGGWGRAHNEEFNDAAEKGKAGREEWIEQNPEQGGEEEEEEDEEVERGSVGRLRGKDMLHNQLSWVFSCSFSSYLLF